MFGYKDVLVFVGMMLVSVVAGSAQQTPRAGQITRPSIHIHAVITDSSGRCVTDLEQWEFAIFDNNSVQPITSFKLVTISPKPIEISSPVDADDGCYQQGRLFQYELTFDAPAAEPPNEYHRVEVKVYRPKLRISSRQGYY